MKRKGFTLIELSVVVLIMAMFAALTVPNMAATVESGNKRNFRQSVITMIRRAKEEALTRGQVVLMSTNSDNGFELSTTVDEQETKFAEVSPVDGVTATNFMKGGSSAGEGDWQMAFYPDGTCEGGSFEFQQNGSTRSVSISKKNCAVTVTDGSLEPENDPDQQWQAGEYEKSG